MLPMTRYAGNAYSENDHTVIAVNAVRALNRPPRYTELDSVSGCFHDLMSVGAVASASARMAKTIAIEGELVALQRTRARSDRSPHA